MNRKAGHTDEHITSGGAPGSSGAPFSEPPPKPSAECVARAPLGAGIPRRGGFAGSHIEAVERIYRNCRYPDAPSFADFFDLYSRSPVAGRMVETFPGYTWDTEPTVTDRGSSKRKTEFERAWAAHTRDVFGGGRAADAGARPVFGVNGVFYALDVLAGIGGEAMLVIGFGDGRGLGEPVARREGTPVSYHKVLHNGQFEVERYNEDQSSVFFGQPETYVTKQWRYGKDANERPPLPHGIRIHRSRCVVFRETRGLEYGVSRIKKSFNTILDIMKVAGASAEVYWLAAYAGVKVETLPDARLDDDDREKMRAEILAYNEGLSRALLMTGAKCELMYPAIVSPRDHFELQLKQLSLDSGIPQRFLIGSEAAKLASQQDTDNWNERVNTRRMTVAVPQAILPYVGRLVEAGALPRPSGGSVRVDWSDKTAVTLRDRMLTARDAANALAVYTGGCGHRAMPFADFLHLVMQYPRDLAMTIAAGYDAAFFEKRAADAMRPHEAGGDSAGEG